MCTIHQLNNSADDKPPPISNNLMPVLRSQFFTLSDRSSHNGTWQIVDSRIFKKTYRFNAILFPLKSRHINSLLLTKFSYFLFPSKANTQRPRAHILGRANRQKYIAFCIYKSIRQSFKNKLNEMFLWNIFKANNRRLYKIIYGFNFNVTTHSKKKKKLKEIKFSKSFYWLFLCLLSGNKIGFIYFYLCTFMSWPINLCKLCGMCVWLRGQIIIAADLVRYFGSHLSDADYDRLCS